MASGDTKTEAMLNALGNGGSADEFRGCCNTKTQQYILDAIDRVQNVEDEVEELKNNPDVVDIVDTYADLQAYDTQHLTENDIIRVLQDETHSGNSTYYRFTKNPDTWTFIGEIAGGGGGDSAAKVLTASDYNWNSSGQSTTAPYDCVALWLLPSGVYRTEANVKVRANKGTDVWNDATNKCFVVANYPNIVAEIFGITSNSGDGGTGNAGLTLYKTSSNGTKTFMQNVLTSGTLLQTTGTSTLQAMSQNAVTSMIYADPGTNTKIKIGDGTSTSEGSNGVEIGYNAAATGNSSVSIGQDSKAEAISATAVGRDSAAKSQSSTAVGHYAKTNGEGSVAIGDNAVGGSSSGSSRAVAIGSNASAGLKGSVALGAYSYAASVGEMNIGSYKHVDHGYNGTQYRLLTGVHDGVSVHDAATVAQGNTLATSAPTTSTVGVLGQLYTDTANMHTYQLTAISGDTYTWTMRW